MEDSVAQRHDTPSQSMTKEVRQSSRIDTSLCIVQGELEVTEGTSTRIHAHNPSPSYTSAQCQQLQVAWEGHVLPLASLSREQHADR